MARVDLARRQEIEKILSSVVHIHPYTPGRKTSDTRLAAVIREALWTAGFVVDSQDARQVLPPGIALWRDEFGEIEPTTLRRRIDMVVYDRDAIAAFIECEEDILNVNREGKHRRYFVQSIAQGSTGRFFSSYRSIERMAVAADVCAHGSQNVIERLSGRRSDDPSVHNALRIPLFVALSCGWNDAGTRLARRHLTAPIGCNRLQNHRA